MQDVNILLYCNTDVVIIKPVTGRARICSVSLKTTRRLIALGFHKEKVALRNTLVCQSKYIELYCTSYVIQYCYIL